MSDYDCIWNAEEGFLAGKCAASMSDSLYDVVYVLHVFPNEASNAWILRYSFICSIGQLVTCLWAFAGAVINEGLSDMRYLILQYKCKVAVLNLHRVRVPHRY